MDARAAAAAGDPGQSARSGRGLPTPRISRVAGGHVRRGQGRTGHLARHLLRDPGGAVHKRRGGGGGVGGGGGQEQEKHQAGTPGSGRGGDPTHRRYTQPAGLPTSAGAGARRAGKGAPSGPNLPVRLRRKGSRLHLRRGVRRYPQGRPMRGRRHSRKNQAPKSKKNDAQETASRHQTEPRGRDTEPRGRDSLRDRSRGRRRTVPTVEVLLVGKKPSARFHRRGGAALFPEIQVLSTKAASDGRGGLSETATVAPKHTKERCRFEHGNPGSKVTLTLMKK
mmetsp:Transcript_24515/g.56013  ORF Transcript_24515/g.56013 Transcript_24515/m.56013 type:complete len:280 (-) Transcript_24515:64-903(-)